MAGKAARRIIRIITDTAGILALMILLAGAGLMLADIRPAIVVSGSMAGDSYRQYGICGYK